MRSLASQTPSQAQTGSAHCEVIFFCLLRSPRWLIHAWRQRAFPKCTRTNHVTKELCVHMSSESGFLRGSRSKTPFISHFKSLIWKSFAFTKGKIRLSNQERVWITFRNGFWNMICSFVNRSNVLLCALWMLEQNVSIRPSMIGQLCYKLHSDWSTGDSWVGSPTGSSWAVQDPAIISIRNNPGMAQNSTETNATDGM